MCIYSKISIDKFDNYILWFVGIMNFITYIMYMACVVKIDVKNQQVISAVTERYMYSVNSVRVII